MRSDGLSGISIQNSVTVNTASPRSRIDEEPPVVCAPCVQGSLALSGEIPEAHAAGRTQPELRLLFSERRFLSHDVRHPPRSSSAVSALLSSSGGGGGRSFAGAQGGKE